MSFPAGGSRVARHLDISCARPDDAHSWYVLGIELAQLGDRNRAMRALRISLGYDADYLPAMLALGRMLFDCGQLEQALLCFERVRCSVGEH